MRALNGSHNGYKERHKTVRPDSLLVQPRPGMQRAKARVLPLGGLGQHRIGQLPVSRLRECSELAGAPDASLGWVYSVSAAQSAANVGDECGSCPD
jgi:hypothetical protein